MMAGSTAEAELAKFTSVLADDWWDPHGRFRTLHDINPTRLRYVEKHAGLAGRTVLDVGCGGGLLTEAMASRGARVTGLDATATAIAAAREHARATAREDRASLEYVLGTPEEYAREHSGRFDVVTCMELLEHVADPPLVIAACAQLLRPGGHVFFSTLNRSLKAWLLAVAGAEYLLRLLPLGTHDYRRFLQPHELAAMCRNQRLVVMDVEGLAYIPLVRHAVLGVAPHVNYLLYARSAPRR